MQNVFFLPNISAKCIFTVCILSTQNQSCKKQIIQVLQNSIFLKDYPPNLSSFPSNCILWTCKLENTLKKSCKLCKYYITSMVLSCGTCQMEENKCTLVKYVIYTFLLQFKFCCNLRNFSAKSLFPDFQNWQKVAYCNFAQNPLILLNYVLFIKKQLSLDVNPKKRSPTLKKSENPEKKEETNSSKNFWVIWS